MSKLYKTDGTVEVINPDNGTDFSLREMQTAVGGNIEVVPVSSNELAVCDEEGLMKSKPFNLGTFHLYGGEFVGDVLIIGKDQIK